MARAKIKKKHPGGRPRIKRSTEHAETVQAMSQYGVPQEDIAATIGMCVNTMLSLYRGEYDRGRTLANAKVGKMLFEKCIKGDTTALIFWAKTRMGWRETSRLDVNLKEPPKVEIVLNAPGTAPETE